ncbi:MAG: isocitrate/isopropylmalate dehydrogenase family protein [Chloroflexi bacterium]|nr:isocitrate/isopropylmalate dehydrogenase family protein [Chloroflexota bacterium]
MSTVCLIPGDGVGQEVISAAAAVIAAILPGAQFVEADAGWDCFLRRGTALPEATLAAVAVADGTLFGATQSPITGGLTPRPPSLRGKGEVNTPPLAGEGTGERSYCSPILAMRKQFDLYANLRPTVQLVPGDRPVDLLIVRENTEGLYAGRERREDADTAIAERVITRRASERIARVAFEHARQRNTQHATRSTHVTIVHKANVLKLTDGLFRESCLAVAKEFSDIRVDEMLVDAAAMWLVKDPTRFDVIVTTNLFGDILSDEAAGLAGGLGVAPSANVGAGRVAVFEPVHGSAPDIAGKGIANPVGAILSAAMLLDHLGESAGAERVRRAVAATIAAGITTPDLGGRGTTAQITEAICRLLT